MISPNQLTMNEALVSGSPMRYARSGSGEALVFVHGYLGGAAIWKDQLDEFSKSFDVLIPELPGYGTSADLASPSSIDTFANHILNLTGALGIDQFNLIGHSMGGMIVQQMTALAPLKIKKLVCYGTGPQGVLPNRFESIDASKFRMKTGGVKETAYRIATSWFIDHKDAVRLPECIEMAKDVTLDTSLAGLTAMESWDGRDTLSKIEQQTLIIWGDKDRSYGWSQPEALWNGIVNSDLCVLPGCGHNAHLEQPDIFNSVVKAFLTRDETKIRNTPNKNTPEKTRNNICPETSGKSGQHR